jgi:hypothetical protein
VAAAAAAAAAAVAGERLVDSADDRRLGVRPTSGIRLLGVLAGSPASWGK